MPFLQIMEYINYIKNNKIAFATAFALLLFYGYQNYKGRACFQCSEETNWGPKNTKRHK
jgi:hypothetical protein